MELLLVRHAEPERVPEGIGPADPGLTPAGRAQAAALAEWLRDEEIDRVVTSPLRRAVETAAPVAAVHGLVPEVVDDLAEYDRYATSYIPVEELRATGDERWHAMAEGRLRELAGVDPAAFRARVVRAVESLIRAHPGGRVVAVCHGGVINAYLGHILGIERALWFEPYYASVARVAASRDGVRSVRSLNERPELILARLRGRL
ncbi:MAG: histidine phosphatase family protein [Chloroflexota bacterium]